MSYTREQIEDEANGGFDDIRRTMLRQLLAENDALREDAEGYASGCMSNNKVTLFFESTKFAEKWFDKFTEAIDAARKKG